MGRHRNKDPQDKRFSGSESQVLLSVTEKESPPPPVCIFCVSAGNVSVAVSGQAGLPAVDT